MPEYSLVIDQASCIQCGTCVEICVQSVLEQGPDGIAVSPKSAPHCIACGHCAAVCPTAAITFDHQDPQGLPAIPTAPLNEDQRTALFKARRSTRQFTNESVPRELVLRALDHARYAPSATNAQQVEWILVEGRPRLNRVVKGVGAWAAGLGGRYKRVGQLVDAGKDPITRGAPAMLLAHCPKDFLWGVHDASAAVSYLELAMHSYGLGTCWAGFVVAASGDGADLNLPLPEGRRLCAGLMFGYPVHFFARLPKRPPLRMEVAK